VVHTGVKSFGCANRSPLAVPEPAVKLDRSGGGLRREVRRDISQFDSHLSSNLLRCGVTLPPADALAPR